ncbi:hypothetical protein BGX34_003729 [Mortierella sp. NVP85]|nr:hypothetical protein BGX34_003729 [Mortierella sp. NVP85]
MSVVQQELYGGAITLNLPPKFENISFHFRQLAEDNDAEDASHIQGVSLLNNAELPAWPSEAKIYLLLGQQRIAKFNERQRQQEAQAQDPAFASGSESQVDPRNLVQIMMVVIRLPLQETDIVITFNVPLHIAETSSSKQVAHEGSIEEAEVWFRNLIASLQVRNWGLFGSGN